MARTFQYATRTSSYAIGHSGERDKRLIPQFQVDGRLLETTTVSFTLRSSWIGPPRYHTSGGACTDSVAGERRLDIIEIMGVIGRPHMCGLTMATTRRPLLTVPALG